MQWNITMDHHGHPSISADNNNEPASELFPVRNYYNWGVAFVSSTFNIWSQRKRRWWWTGGGGLVELVRTTLRDHILIKDTHQRQPVSKRAPSDPSYRAISVLLYYLWAQINCPFCVAIKAVWLARDNLIPTTLPMHFLAHCIQSHNGLSLVMSPRKGGQKTEFYIVLVKIGSSIWITLWYPLFNQAPALFDTTRNKFPIKHPIESLSVIPK